MSSRPRIKICGITRPKDARLALELGADYLGLNFFAGSSRGITVDQAKAIRQTVGERAPLIGVFVNHRAAEIDAIAAAVGLDLLQFHGDETVEDLRPFASRAIKVFRVGADFDVRQLQDYSDCWGFLLDTWDRSQYGGTGRAWDHEQIRRLDTDKPVFVAGGLGPGSIGPLLLSSKIFGLDICSGVESAPGCKDPELMRQMFEEIRDVETASTS